MLFHKHLSIFDLKDEDLIAVSDFHTGAIDEKIKSLLDKMKDSFITYENFKIIQKGKFYAHKKEVPYLVFSASVKNVPFKEVVGVVGAYSNLNKNQKPSTKLIVSIVDKKAYNSSIVKNFVTSLRIK